MNRLKLNHNHEDKKIITFTINKTIKDKLKEILFHSDKYTLKMKSVWINESILMLKNNPDYKEMIYNAEGNNEDFVFDKIYMSFEQRCQFAELRKEVVMAHPDIQGPQGAIIRAAILSRLTRRI